MSDQPSVDGTVAPGFEGVRDAFRGNFADRLDVGAAVAIYQHGEPVVDMWGGFADPTSKRPWKRGTTTLVYSATKGVTSTLLQMLAEENAIDLDRPVAEYWPEFGDNGKERITVKTLISHRAGLPALEEKLSRQQLLEPHAAARALARQNPLWEPGTAHGYHALTFGWLVGEIVWRATGRTVSDLVAQRIAKPLGLEFWIGVPGVEEVDYAPIIDGVRIPGEIDTVTDAELKARLLQIRSEATNPDSLFSRALTSNGALPTPDAATWNDELVLRAEQAGANGVTNARSLAKMYAACLASVGGVRLLSDAAVQAASVEQAYGSDRVLLGQSRFGVGYALHHAGAPLLGPRSFGHAGVGGAIGFADPQFGISFAYTPNQLNGSALGDRRLTSLIQALRKAINA